MRTDHVLPILPTVARAYRLLWRERLLHAKAIWPPVLFLVAAEFLYHRVMGQAHTLADRWHAVQASAWYMLPLAAIAWLAGLKFLLSFSISWRRHLMLGERFDPFFFHAPFWKYLGLLLLTYAWAIPAFVVLAFLIGLAGTAAGVPHRLLAAISMLAGLPVLWGIVRQVPYFNALTRDPPHPGWRESVAAMRGTVWRYVVVFGLAMLPIAGLNLLLDSGLKLAGADPHQVPVALGESVFRQTMLFLHFSLGASIGALLFGSLFGGTRPGAPLSRDAAGAG